MKLSRVSLSYIGLVIVYLLLGALLPPNTATVQAYHLTTTEYHVVALLASIPVILVWFAAFYGYAVLAEYSHVIRKAADGLAFDAISRGVRWLAWGLPISSIVTSLLGGIVHSRPGLVSTAFIIIHYVPLLVSLFAFTYISTGSRQLMGITRSRLSLQAIRLMILCFSIIGVLYTYFTLQDAQAGKLSPYHMPVWLVMLTIIIPYLYAWFMGLLGAYELYLFSKHTKGFLYKRALNTLAGGLTIAILTSVILQYIASDTTHLRKITFNALLLAVYLLLIVYAAGFGLIALGAKRLKKIEEV